MPDSFVHLHQHTEFSMLDGAARIGDIVGAAVADGQPAMGITDHGNMYGVLDFYKACRDRGVKPIIGTEAYMAHDSRAERPPRRGRVDDSGGEVEGGRKLYYHLTLLAENNDGYKNLIQLASRAYMEGYYYKPRIDWELLEAHHEGVIATTGCLGGHVLQALMNTGFDAALEKAARLQDIFGRDNLFVEIQDQGLARTEADQPGPVRDRPTDQGTAPRHERQPLRPPRGRHRPRCAAVRADGIAHERPRPIQVPRRRALPEVGA